jgi:hypothetical protein
MFDNFQGFFKGFVVGGDDGDWVDIMLKLG